MSKIVEEVIQIKGGHQINLLELQNNQIKIILIPEIGGKIISIESKRTKINYLLNSGQQHLVPGFGHSFDLRYAYGFDECFPTIASCDYKSEVGTVSLPDHGEVWSRAWDYEYKDDAIILSIEGITLDYFFKKEIKLHDTCLVINYSLENKSDFSFDYIWSSHPLLSVNEGDQILLSKEIERMMIDWTSDPGLGKFRDWINWPVESWGQEKIDWSVVRDRKANIAVKLFSDRLRQGQAAIYKKNIDESLLLRFDADKIPYLGLWLCYEGWPENKDTGSYTIALEPASARPDALKEAVAKNEASKIKARALHQWKLEFSFVNGKVTV